MNYYMLLGRLQLDCDYFLGAGRGNPKSLWAGSVKEQLEKMKSIYEKLPEKPEWLSWKQIEKYKKLMNEKEKQNESRNI